MNILSNCVRIALFCFLYFSCPPGEPRSLFCLQLCSACPLKSVLPCQHIPSAQSLWCLSHSHTSICLNLSPLPPSLSLFLLSLLPSHPATSLAAAQFLFSGSALLAFVVSECCQLSPLSTGPWVSILHVHPQCPSFSVILTHLFFLLCLLPSSPVLYCSVLFFFPVLSFIHSSHLLFIPPLSFLCLTGPQRFLLKRIPSTGD